jgi:hypothetical protein
MSLHSANTEKSKLGELRAKRKRLWMQFENNPNEIHLAAILKVLDDQIAQGNQQNDGDVESIYDSEVVVVPEVGGLFLLVGLSQRTGCKPDSVQSSSRDSASACANYGSLEIASTSFEQ